MPKDTKSKLNDETAKRVSELKKLISRRVKQLRIDKHWSQDALGVNAGVDRSIVVRIEKAKDDYRIDSLVAVLLALKADESIIFSPDPLKKKLAENIEKLFTKGDIHEISFVAQMIERAVADPDTTRAPTKPRRSA